MNQFGLIGYPLEHSFSNTYFTQKFEKENLTADNSFTNFPIQSISELPAIINKYPDLKGLAVTIPYKQVVMQYLSVIDDAAKQIGAVNCISIKNKVLMGYNTDAVGFESSFRPLLKNYHTKALILGTGGSSKAVQFVLDKLHIQYAFISRKMDVENNILEYEMLNEEYIREHLVIINCTPVGMYPQVEDQPQLPYHFLTAKHYLFDLIYNPEETLFLNQGKKHGATIKNGYDMLLIQAEENWRIWNR